MALELTVLGSEPAWPSAGLACSGYLVQTSGATVLVDCGTGVFERLRGLLPPEGITAIVISHLHFDHWLDLIPFRYYLKYEARPDKGPRLLVPPAALSTLEQIAGAIDGDHGFFEQTFVASEYRPDERLQIEDLSIRFQKTLHPIDTYALRLEAADSVIAYSADTGWHPPLADFARGADVFLCEAAFGTGESFGNMHLTAAEAAQLAGSAHACRLLLTHVAVSDAAPSVEIAQREFKGQVSHAAAGTAFVV